MQNRDVALHIIDNHAAASQKQGGTEQTGKLPAFFGIQEHSYRFFLMI